MIFNPINKLSTNLGGLVRLTKFYTKRLQLGFSKNPNTLANIYFATVHKSGSQWINALFSDKRIQRITGLPIYPQHHYDINDFRLSFPRNAFVSGLYIDYPLYDVFIDKSEQYRTLFIYRDPRDMVVSWYFSAKLTHSANRGVIINRKRLCALTEDEGIYYCINYLAPRFAAIRTWVELGAKDKNVTIVKFEDFVARPAEILTNLLVSFGYEFDCSVIRDVVEDYSKDKMRSRSLKHGPGSSESHYRQISSSHLDFFNEQHYASFYGITGDLIERLGYKR